MDLNFLSFPIALLTDFSFLSLTVVLSIGGLFFLLLGLLGKIRIKDFEVGTDSVPIRVVLCLLGLALLLAAYLVYKSDKPIPPCDPNINICPTPSLVPSNTPTPTPIPSPNPSPTPPKPDVLIDIIISQQHDNVKESYGELAGQNFSNVDLMNFRKQGKVADITKRLKTDSLFLDVVLVIKHMTASERQKLLDKALNKHRPTWAELERIDKAGQTEAGQQAERLIAEGIVNLVKDLSRLPDEEIRRLQREGDQD